MAIEIKEKLEVEAPIDSVWKFVIDPESVVTCMPGAELVERVDETTYIGRVKVKLGAITTAYEGKVVFESVDAQNHRIRIQGQGRETGGGTAKGTVEIQLCRLPEGLTEMRTQARVDLTGRVMQVGRGMIKGVSHQLFQQFATRAKQKLESASADVQRAPAAVASDDAALRVLPLLLQTALEAIRRFLRRIFGGEPD